MIINHFTAMEVRLFSSSEMLLSKSNDIERTFAKHRINIFNSDLIKSKILSKSDFKENLVEVNKQFFFPLLFCKEININL